MNLRSTVGVRSLTAGLAIAVLNSAASATLTYTDPASHGAGPTTTNQDLNTFVANYKPADHDGATLEAIILTLKIEPHASYQITDNPNQGIGATGIDFQYTNPYNSTLKLFSNGQTLVASSIVLSDVPRHLDPNTSYATPDFPSVFGLTSVSEVTVTFEGASLTQELKDAFTQNPNDPINNLVDMTLFVAQSASYNVVGTDQYAIHPDSAGAVRHLTSVVYGYTAVPEPTSLGMLAGVAMLCSRRRAQ